MIAERILCSWILIDRSIAQLDLYYAYPDNVYQAQTNDQFPQLQQPLQPPEPQPETGLYLMAKQTTNQNDMYTNNQIGAQDIYNYQPAMPIDYFQNTPNQNFFQDQQNTNFYHSPMNPNMQPGEFVVCADNLFPNPDCINPIPSTTPPPMDATPPTDCTYSGRSAATTPANTTESDEDPTPPATTTTSTVQSNILTNTQLSVSIDSADTNNNPKIINSSNASSKNNADSKTQYFLHEKKRKIKVNARQNKMFVRKLVNESSKGKVLVPYRNTMSMTNHGKDSRDAVRNT